MTGQIKNVNQEKMYGFIIGEDGLEYFYHRECLVNASDWDELDRGRKVTFEPTITPKGKRAENLLIL